MCFGCGGSFRPHASKFHRKSIARLSNRLPLPKVEEYRRPRCRTLFAVRPHCPWTWTFFCLRHRLQSRASTALCKARDHPAWRRSVAKSGTSRGADLSLPDTSLRGIATHSYVSRAARCSESHRNQTRHLACHDFFHSERHLHQETLQDRFDAKPRCHVAQPRQPPSLTVQVSLGVVHRSPYERRRASARPTDADATASSRVGWQSCRAGVLSPMPERTGSLQQRLMQSRANWSHPL